MKEEGSSRSTASLSREQTLGEPSPPPAHTPSPVGSGLPGNRALHPALPGAAVPHSLGAASRAPRGGRRDGRAPALLSDLDRGYGHLPSPRGPARLAAGPRGVPGTGGAAGSRDPAAGAPPGGGRGGA